MVQKFSCSVLLLFFSFVSFAQNQTPCQSEGHRQFDFWIGEWEVFNTQADTVVGYNHIKRILNGCVIEENWTGASGFRGKSFNTYNPADSTWNQIWVDGTGGRYEFSGKFADNVMALKGETYTNGKRAWFTLTFTYHPDKDTVRQVWMITYDNEKWATLFDGIYRRIERKKNGRVKKRKE